MDITADLTAAIDGLWFMSETDAPFTVIHWPTAPWPLSPEQLRTLAVYPEHAPVEVLSLADFWGTGGEYQALHQTLTRHLTDLRVYRIGTIEIGLYILGLSPEREVFGVATQAVET